MLQRSGVEQRVVICRSISRSGGFGQNPGQHRTCFDSAMRCFMRWTDARDASCVTEATSMICAGVISSMLRTPRVLRSASIFASCRSPFNACSFAWCSLCFCAEGRARQPRKLKRNECDSANSRYAASQIVHSDNDARLIATDSNNTVYHGPSHTHDV